MDCDKFGCNSGLDDYGSGGGVSLEWLPEFVGVLILIIFAFSAAIQSVESIKRRSYPAFLLYACLSVALFWGLYELINWQEFANTIKGYVLLGVILLSLGAGFVGAVYLLKFMSGIFSESIRKVTIDDFFEQLLTYAHLVGVAAGGLLAMLFPMALLAGLIYALVSVFK